MLKYGSPEQLDSCDAWAHSLNLAKDAGIKNRTFLVGELLSPSDIQLGTYDFIFAFSIFTHLSSAVFLPNIKTLMSALKPRGRLYLTVRHDDFFPSLERKVGKLDLIPYEREGFVHITYPGEKMYGETVVTSEFMRTHLSGLGKLSTLGTPDILQHLYKITLT
jgi:SAM-dependent methyltransferase